MFPFTLAGPQFLVFYAAFGTIVLALLSKFRFWAESGPLPRPRLDDPYLIAYLRGGKNEAIFIATLSLVDRGLLKADETMLKSAGAEAIALVRRPLEKALLKKYHIKGEAKAAFGESVFEAPTREYQQRLEGDGLIADAATRKARFFRLLGALALLWMVGGARVAQGLGRGRPVLFLIGLALLFSILAVTFHNPRRTPAGDAIMADLRQLFASLKARAATLQPGGATAEAALVAGVFGLAALQGWWSFARKLYPTPTSSDSSCSSAVESSCGSSCGGGGGGGGCGGCGG